MKKNFLFLISFMLAGNAFSQEVLKLEDAINAAIKNHWSVRIAENLKSLSEQQHRNSYLSVLPDVSLNAATSRSSNNLMQEFSSGLTVDRNGVKSSNTNGTLSADLTLFNGFRVYHAHNRFKELKKGAELNLSLMRENLVYDVSYNYYSLIRKKLELDELKKSLAYSEERVKIADMKFQSGASAKPELLQAQIDLNMRRSEVLRKEQELIELKASFNTLIGKESTTEFDVSDTLVVNTAVDLNTMLSAYQNNKSIGVQKSLVTVSEHRTKEIRSDYFPRINAIANYNFILNKSEAGFQLFNRTTGINTGLGLSWDLFTGGARRINTISSKIETANLMLEHEQISAEVKSKIYSQYRKLINATSIYAIEKENYNISSENLLIATERYKLGMTSMLELIEAQRNSDIASSRLFLSNFESKIAELDLRRNTGQLWP